MRLRQLRDLSLQQLLTTRRTSLPRSERGLTAPPRTPQLPSANRPLRHLLPASSRSKAHRTPQDQQHDPDPTSAGIADKLPHVIRFLHYKPSISPPPLKNDARHHDPMTPSRVWPDQFRLTTSQQTNSAPASQDRSGSLHFRLPGLFAHAAYEASVGALD